MKKNRKSLVDMINAYLEEKGEKADVRVVHRLDKDVGGIMVYAKNHFAASKLSKSIQSGEMIKEYSAVVHSRPSQANGFFEDLLFKDSKSNKSFVVKNQRKGVKKAKLYYETVFSADTRFGEASLVKIRLYTGRTHQIRVQFSSRKMPLLGDKKYGGNDECPIALRSYRITFEHPSARKIMVFETDHNFNDIFNDRQ